jgi:hypothetical protein
MAFPSEKVASQKLATRYAPFAALTIVAGMSASTRIISDTGRAERGTVGLALGPAVKMGLLGKSHQVVVLRLHEDWDEGGTEASQRCTASGERWFDLIGNMDSALAGCVVVMFGLDQRMKQLGGVRNGSVDQFAFPFVLDVFA